MYLDFNLGALILDVSNLTRVICKLRYWRPTRTTKFSLFTNRSSNLQARAEEQKIFTLLRKIRSCFHGSLRTSRFVFLFDEVYRTPRLAYRIYLLCYIFSLRLFFPQRISERYRSSVRGVLSSSPGEFNIAKRNCRRRVGNRPVPKRVVPDALSSLFLLHTGWCTGAGDLQLQLPRQCVARGCTVRGEKCRARRNARRRLLPLPRTRRARPRKTIRYDGKLRTQ